MLDDGPAMITRGIVEFDRKYCNDPVLGNVTVSLSHAIRNNVGRVVIRVLSNHWF